MGMFQMLVLAKGHFSGSRTWGGVVTDTGVAVHAESLKDVSKELTR